MQLTVIGDDDTSSWLWTCVGQSTLFSQTSAYYLLYFITTLVCLVWNQLLMWWWWPACLCFAAVCVCVCRLTRWLGFIFLLLCHHLAYTYHLQSLSILWLKLPSLFNYVWPILNNYVCLKTQYITLSLATTNCTNGNWIFF